MVLLRSVAWRHLYRNVYRLITRTDPNRGILSTLPLCANQMPQLSLLIVVDRVFSQPRNVRFILCSFIL